MTIHACTDISFLHRSHRSFYIFIVLLVYDDPCTDNSCIIVFIETCILIDGLLVCYNSNLQGHFLPPSFSDKLLYFDWLLSL